jgi:hypothetical protein
MQKSDSAAVRPTSSHRSINNKKAAYTPTDLRYG